MYLSTYLCLSHRAPTILDPPTSRLSSPAVLHIPALGIAEIIITLKRSPLALDGHQPWRLNVSIYVSWECPGLLPRTSSLEARLLLREVFASSNRSAPTITGMITRRRCFSSMDIKVFMFEKFFFLFFFFIIISVVYERISSDILAHRTRCEDIMLLYSMIIRAIDSKFQLVWWLIMLKW